MSNLEPHFSPQYIGHLQQDYPANIVQDIVADWQYADLDSPPGEHIAYVRINHGVSRPVLYVPGFNEGIIAKAPFAADLASRGHDVILPDQNRKKIVKDAISGKKDATLTQACNYLAVLAAEDLVYQGPVDVVTHSYGSLIFEAMHAIAEERGYNAFKGSRVVMLAPAGFYDQENMRSLAWRFMAMNLAGSKAPMEYGDVGGEMMRAGVKNATANAVRWAREGWHLAHRHIDTGQFFEAGIGSLAIVTYGEDTLYSDDLLYPAVGRAVANGASWVRPIALDLHGPKGIEGSTHNDEQFNPSRVAPAVSAFLQAA